MQSRGFSGIREKREEIREVDAKIVLFEPLLISRLFYIFLLRPCFYSQSQWRHSVILNSASVDKILWFDHSNKTLSAVLSHGTIYI